MNRIGRIAATAVFTALLSFVGAGLSAEPAVAACSGSTCTGFDPIAQGCTATSTMSNSDSLVKLDNRYSLGCNANWARAELTQLAYNNGDKFIVMIWTVFPDGSSENMCYPGGPSNMGQTLEPCSGATLHAQGWWHTDMVNGTYKTYAVVTVYDSHGNSIDQLHADQ